MGLWKRLFGRKAKHAAALPAVGPEHLHRDFGRGSREPSGAGARQMLAARDSWNANDYDTAYNQFHDATVEGLDGPWLSVAHCCLGQICVKRRELLAAVSHFLKCLEIPYRDSGDAWQSARRLHIIYREAGRPKEAAALRELAEAANKQHGWAHTPQVEAELRQLTRTWLSTSTGAAVQASSDGGNRASKSQSESPLVRALIHGNDDESNDALAEVKRLAQSGNDSGLEALALAIRTKAGKPDAKMYVPGVFVGASDYEVDYGARLVQLAAAGRLWEDPHETGRLISRFVSNNEPDALHPLLTRVQRAGGQSQEEAFIYIYSYCKYYSALQKSLRT